jgi:hypothetical protein
MPTAFQKRLATIAQTQYDKFRFIRENQEPLASQIETYWTGLGFKFLGVEVAWSAVFVSWCVKQAGATKTQFTFAHTRRSCAPRYKMHKPVLVCFAGTT